MKTIYNYDGIIVKHEPEKRHNPYRIYRRYDGHTRKIVEYADLISRKHGLKKDPYSNIPDEILRELIESISDYVLTIYLKRIKI